MSLNTSLTLEVKNVIKILLIIDKQNIHLDEGA